MVLVRGDILRNSVAFGSKCRDSACFVRRVQMTITDVACRGRAKGQSYVPTGYRSPCTFVPWSVQVPVFMLWSTVQSFAP
jgi:hypothetical protein